MLTAAGILHDAVMRRIESGWSPDDLTGSADGDDVLRRLEEVERLDAAGERERAVLRLYISQGACSLLPIERFRELFASCDRARLREETDPLPPGESFALFRGVVYEWAAAPVVDGLSWTTSIWVARYFAERPLNFQGQPFQREPVRQVWSITVPESAVYAHVASWHEFIVDPALPGMPAPMLVEEGAALRRVWRAAGFDRFTRALVAQAPGRSVASDHVRRRRCRACGGDHKSRAHDAIVGGRA